MSNTTIEGKWPWTPTTHLRTLPEHTHPALKALAQMEAQRGLSRQVIWRYGELFEVIMGELVGQVQPLGFWRGRLVAALVDDGVSDEVLAYCAQRLWHVQTSSPRVCDRLGAHVPSFHVTSMACVQALARYQPEHLTASLDASDMSGWPTSMTSPLTITPVGHERALGADVLDALLRGQWRTISVEFDIPEPSIEQRRAMQLNPNCQTLTWPGGQLGQPALVERAPALWASPGYPRHFIPLMCLQNHIAQMWMMWDRAVKRPRAMRCDGYSLESLGRPGPFGVLPATEQARGPWSSPLPDGAGWACSFLSLGAHNGSAFVGPGRRFAIVRCLNVKAAIKRERYQQLWAQHPQRGGSIWLETDQPLEQATFASLVFEGQEAVVEWCGFQRVYRLRDGHLSCLTTDHTWANLMLGGAGGANAQMMQNIILVTIGMDVGALNESVGRVEYQRRVSVEAGDRFLLADASLERALGIYQLTQWMSASTPAEAVQHMQNATLYGESINCPVMVVDADAIVGDHVPSSGPLAYNFEGSEAYDLERMVCDEPLVLNSATLFFDPPRFDGQLVEFAGVLNFPNAHTRVVADAWWNVPPDQALPDFGAYIVRARGLWCADGGRYGEGGAYKSEFRGHLEIVEPIAQVHVPPDEARWYRYMIFSSDGVVQQAPDGWSWQGLPMRQGGPLSAQTTWPTVTQPQRRPARIVAAACHSQLLVFSIQWLGPPIQA